MTTTHLFVELLVIGFGAIAWLVLLGAAVFGYDLDHRFLTWKTLVPLLSVVYVLGIIVDRVADWVLDRLDRRHLDKYFKDNRDAYFVGRRTLVVFGPELWAHLEYGRSRLRICRGWALNAIMFLIAVNAYHWTHHPAILQPGWRLVTANFALAIFCGLCFACWWRLNKKEYQKIQRQSDWIEEMQRKGAVDGRPTRKGEVRARPGQVADAAGLPGEAESLEG